MTLTLNMILTLAVTSLSLTEYILRSMYHGIHCSSRRPKDVRAFPRARANIIPMPLEPMPIRSGKEHTHLEFNSIEL
ncbi:uncharacterized protein F4807DRAFT_12135 [Annulohypoxylon truncatum]|uniref:uncharacterized protein n=1 Tax=Annulohypoxylon truncatum TaxID=327061 RepID=UPI002007542C|nr:uncharacterized protein F4807DRAFT_12135 [Annulohypoxylon truncatum]KAI1214886.1 hypothetical protein F4807DRAFT_12135 [Annulohypoxylon truncatum]